MEQTEEPNPVFVKVIEEVAVKHFDNVLEHIDNELRTLVSTYVDGYMDRIKGALFKELLMNIEAEVVAAKKAGNYEPEKVAKMNPEGTNQDVPLSVDYEHVIEKKYGLDVVEETSEG